MKGLSIGVAFAFLVMIIVIFIMIALANRNVLVSSELTEEFSRLLGKEMLTTDGTEWFEVSTEDAYRIKVHDLKFTYIRLDEEGREEIDFFVIANFKDKVDIAGSDYNPRLIEYPKEGKDDALELEFEITTDKPESIDFLHLTFWRDSQCIRDYFKERGDDFSDLLARCHDSYIASVDMAGVGWKERALLVSLDPGDPPLEVWSFRLLQDRSEDYEVISEEDSGAVKFALDDFDLDSRPGAECAVLAADEQGGSNSKAAIWYVLPGGIIKKEGNMYEGIKNHITYNGEKLVGCIKDDGPCDYCIKNGDCDIIMAGPETLGRIGYTEEITSKCIDISRLHSCSLLMSIDDEYYWQPKYELLCSDNGFWMVCHEDRKDAVVTAGGRTYRCDRDTGKWIG